MMATEEEIAKVIESTDMVELVSPYVKLLKQGKNYKGLCPFHNEDTPSFVVSQEKHVAHCFGCGKGGNPINFLMQIKQISFNEALAELAQKNGISLNVKLPNSQKQDYTKYYELMQVAAKFYQQNLNQTQSGKKALNYLYERGLDDNLIKDFQIGLAPSGLDQLYKVLKDANYLELDMLDLGLIGKNDKGYYDMFVKRIMFPICDEKGHVIGFSGRIFDDSDKSQPKYVNTKETFLYHKGNILYHFDKAQPEILRKKRFILHEGQMDVIAANKAGFNESICTMGTALTLDQALFLKKYANEAIICYDGDKAGINASLKAIKIFKQAGINVHLVLLPNGMDPDEYIKNNGKEAYATYFEEHIIDDIEYQFETLLLNVNLNDESVVEQVKNNAFNILRHISSQTTKDKYLSLLAVRLAVKLDSLIIDYNNYYTAYLKEDYVEESLFDDNFTNDFDNVAKTIKDDVFKRDYELRLFLYARSSKELALDIDSKIFEYMNAFSEINRQIWVALINNYYTQYETFDDKIFCSLLTEEQRQVYLDNLESLRGSAEVYNDKDLANIIKKMHEDTLKYENKKLSSQIDELENSDDKIAKISKKFQNRKRIMDVRRN